MLKFIVYRHFTNGFVIWSYVMYGFHFIKNIPVIESFRTSLWVDQTMWIFLIPMLIQNWFSISTGVKLKNVKFQNKRDSFLVPFVITSAVALIFVSYAIFVWDVFSIIPDDHPETWVNKTIDHETYSILMLIGGHINSGTAIMFMKTEKYFVKKYSIHERPLWPKKLENKAIMMIFGLEIPLLVFVIYNCLIEPRFLV